MTYTYQWEQRDVAGLNPVDIGGATGSTYVVQAGDVGKRIGVRVSDGVSTVEAAPTVVVVGSPPVPVGALLFSDEFDAPLDLSVWDVKNRVTRSGTTFLPGNVSVHDGLLDIKANLSAGKWFGGEIQLLGAHGYTGPRYTECIAKVPAGFGTWPAPLWEYDADFGSLGRENDVNEQLGREPTIYHSTVHDSDSTSFGKPFDTGVVLSNDFHRYGCAMYADHADYYFDGTLIGTITHAEAVAHGVPTWPFTTQKMVCLVDLDMGGDWAGTPTIPGPVHLLVGYVRIWALA